jgi:hypothetical protein
MTFHAGRIGRNTYTHTGACVLVCLCACDNDMQRHGSDIQWHGKYMALTWQWHGKDMGVTAAGKIWQIHGNDMAMTWQWHGNDMAMTGNGMANIWQRYGNGMAKIMQWHGKDMAVEYPRGEPSALAESFPAQQLQVHEGLAVKSQPIACDCSREFLFGRAGDDSSAVSRCLQCPHRGVPCPPETSGHWQSRPARIDQGRE